jgi:hypothetical protein
VTEPYEVHVLRGERAGGPPSLLLEVPHGATDTADYTRVRARLRGELPAGLDDFFHVNTDVGAAELALAIAARFVAHHPERAAVVLRCRVPRTFVDCNRVLDLSAAEYKAGGVTPGLPSYVRHPDDAAWLRGLHAAYQARADALFAEVCGVAGGLALMVHTYAPRTVDVEVDEDIGAKLRAAWAPDVEPTWPLRPPVDLIVREPSGEVLAHLGLMEAVRRILGEAGHAVALGETYPLHPATAAHAQAKRYPGRTLCFEVRRDLLADPWDPFVQMRISAEKVARLAEAFAGAIRSC